MLKILTKKRYKELIESENTLKCRVKNSNTTTYEDLIKLKEIIIDEYKDVEYRLRGIQNIYKKLKK